MEERTYRAVIESPRVGAFNVQIHRELVFKDASGEVVSTRTVPTTVHRLAAGIASDSITLANGTVVLASTVLAALPLFFDLWAEQDIAAGRR